MATGKLTDKGGDTADSTAPEAELQQIFRL
jgi:hypothetical protein